MDCMRLLDTLDYLGYGGVCVGTENSQILQNSLLILQKENHFRKCYYWGRINGVQNDYYIAYGYENECLNGRIYFYSTNCLDWMLMPKTTKCGRFLAPLAVTKLEGDTSIISNVYKANPPYPPNEDPKRHYEGPMPSKLKEEDRLASIVEMINDDAFIIPRGAWFKCPNGEIRDNPGFQGLSLFEAQQLKSFLHGRSPQQKWNTNLLTRSDYNYAIDFLDTIDRDVPEGCWNLQLVQGCCTVILHSLFWPGMIFYHTLNSPHYGSLYVGHGKKNLDVPFMI